MLFLYIQLVPREKEKSLQSCLKTPVSSHLNLHKTMELQVLDIWIQHKVINKHKNMFLTYRLLQTYI